MSRRRRAVLLAGLALALGAVAAADVQRREGALAARLGPAAAVLVARTDLPAGAALAPTRVAVRSMPARYVPPQALTSAAAAVGLRTAVAVPAGMPLTAGQLGDRTGAAPGAPGAPVRPGERAAEVVAHGSPELVPPGSRVDVLVTREAGRGGAGGTVVALEDVEVLAAGPAPEAGGAAADGGPRVAATLRVTLRQAVYLAAAQSFAREIRLLPRAAGDARRGAAGLAVGAGL
jgi:pilus assembly protein CpaB